MKKYFTTSSLHHSTTLIFSVGGSIVVPNGEINTDFLCGFQKLVHTHAKQGRKFVVVVGGGGTARQYQRAAKAVGKVTSDDLDWLGIHSTRLNGHLMRTIFRDIAHPVMYKDPTRVPHRFSSSVLVAAGWKPGWSTDYVAVRIAKRLGATLVLNLSNTDYVYDKDPQKHAEAIPISEITWKDFRRMVGNTWDPGMSAPFDPVASRLAHRAGIQVVLLNGKNLKNLDALLRGDHFVGTVIG